MKYFTILLITVLSSTGLHAQSVSSSPIKKQINSKIEQGILVSNLTILEQTDFEFKEKERYISQVEFYKLLPNTLPSILEENSELLSINFDNRMFMLQSVNLFADNYRLITSDGLEKSAPEIKFYHGYIVGETKSHVAFSFSRNGMKAYIVDSNGTYEINKIEKDTYEGHYISDAVDQLNFTCDTDDTSFGSEDQKSPKLESDLDQRTSTDCVEIFFETDFTSYQDLGSSVTNVENWLADIFNEVAILYANESIPIVISETFVWTSAANPLDTTASTYEALRAFAHSRQNNYNGRLAHYISTRPLGGGVAQVNALCDVYSPSGSGPYGVSASLKIPTVPFPTYSWNVYVIAHELGHNFGSRHTHSCVWDINNDGIAMERIDDCSRGSCYDSLNEIIPANGGTIMSYCHLNSVGINFNSGFGPLPGALISNTYLNAPCVTGGCNGVCNIVGINAVLLDCDNNGTPVNFSDDIFEIEINPVGFNLTGTYNVSGSISATGNYGTPLTLDNNGSGFTPGATISIIVTDANDSNCFDTAQVVIPSGCVSFNSCQDALLVSLPYLGADPGPSNGGGAQNSPASHSNWYKFIANCSSTVTVSSCLGGADTRLWVYEGNCANLVLEDQADDECKDNAQSFFNLASESTFVVYDGNTYYIEWDNRWSEDAFSFTIEYNHTSCGPCEILDAGVVITDCDNNGTPNNSNDDTYDLSISPSAVDFGSAYTITGDLNGTATFGNAVSFTGLPAGNSNLNISITDNNDSNCTLNLTIADPGSCSYDAPLIVPDCNDFENGELLPNWTGDIGTSGNPLAAWNVLTGPTPSSGSGPSFGYDNTDYYLYFEATGAQFSTTYTLHSPVYDLSNISDPQVRFATHMFGSCIGTLMVDYEEPAGSGNYINILTQSGEVGDFWLPQIIPLCDVTETLISFRFSVIHCDGSSGTFGWGDIGIDEFCVEKGPDCSSCSISNPGLIPGVCNDNGTPSNPNDDFEVITLDPTGNLLGTNYTVSGDVSASGVYGSSISFPIPIGVGDLNITLTDDNDLNCFNNFIITDNGDCSNVPPNSTPSCQSFEQRPLPSIWYGDLSSNSNGAPGLWNISSNGRTPSSNTGPLEAYNSDEFIFFETGTIVSPIPAGDFAVLYTPTYNVNGLSDPTLSFASYFFGDCVGTLTVELESPINSGVYSTVYSHSGEVGEFWEIQSIPLCNLIDSLVAFKITATACDGSTGPVNRGDIAIDELCVIDGADCNSCAIIGAALIIDDCDMNGSPTDDNDDIYSLSIIPSGYLLGSSYSISGDLTANGTYGSPLFIDNLLAGNGNLNITVMDDNNTNCSLQITIQDPGACSNFTPIAAPTCIDFEDGSLPEAWSGDVASFGLSTHWSVDSGGTPTGSTGPSSGNNGSVEYLYFESSGTAASDSAIVYSMVFDISGLSDPHLNFSSHLWGDCIGTLALEIESPAASGNYVNVFSLSGNQGDMWIDHEVPLCSFTDNLIAIKIIAVACAGSPVFRGDIAIDDICIQEGPVCPCPDVMTQNSSIIIDGLYEADSLIRSAATVQTNGSSILKAGTSVELLHNFHCPPNSELHVYIESCSNN